jgi:hypothetical protein
MELSHNSTFRILKNTASRLQDGIYRVVVDHPATDTTIAVHIQDERGGKRGRGGRSPRDHVVRRKRAPLPSVGAILWLDRRELNDLHQAHLLRPITIARDAKVHHLKLSDRARIQLELRRQAATVFLDYDSVSRTILDEKNVGRLVRAAMSASGLSRSAVRKVWSLLCRFGFWESSLVPRHDRSGGPGVPRPCEIPGGRRKAGRKTTAQRIARFYGITLEPEQPGMSIEWRAAIFAADRRIPLPKPSWPKRCDQIVMNAFVAEAKEEDGKISLIKPAIGTYPNDSQIRRVLESGDKLQQLVDKTTKRHFDRARRGLTARDWEGVSGPGHMWMIDSTIGDIFLRSSINRAWVIGRPVVYIIVDVWSTAVVGFYVCLTGPSWNMAKIALFNASADARLIGALWRYTPTECLVPCPTLPYQIQCDRGEYLSRGHRETALKLIPLTSYAPPYAGDLKGLCEVLHRIQKDAQFFCPGAFDARREEMERRKVNPNTSVLTLPEYVRYLQELFTLYNLTADRSHRVDPYMLSDDVVPSPAGLWNWGHGAGVGFRRSVDEYDRISALLPRSTGRVRRDCVRFLNNDYMSEEIKEAQWTTMARNCGGWNIDVHYYPGSLGRIWTPRLQGSGAYELTISDQSRSSADLSLEEWLDSESLRMQRQPQQRHDSKMLAVDIRYRMNELTKSAQRLTREAIERASRPKPTMREARAMEVEAQSAAPRDESGETSPPERLTEEAMESHSDMVAEVLRAYNEGDADDA